MAKSLEAHLYRSALTKEKYMDQITLRDRLQIITQALASKTMPNSANNTMPNRLKPDESQQLYELLQVDKVLIQPDGSIVIPATSFVDPSKPSKNVLVMKSFLGGNQLHLEHDGQVEYELPPSIVTASTFALSVKVVNVHRDQKPLLVNIEKSPNIEESSSYPNDQVVDGYEMIHLPQGQEMEVQYTKGRWEQTKSIRVDLSPGGRLKLSRKVPCWGLTIKEIVLQPIGISSSINHS